MIFPCWQLCTSHRTVPFADRCKCIGFDADKISCQPRPMKFDSIRMLFSRKTGGCTLLGLAVLIATFTCGCQSPSDAESQAGDGWRELPLISGGKVDPNWVFLGYGRFAVDDGELRTDCDPKGLGLLVYRKERLGNCQIRVVFKTKDARSNSGVYVRIADGILDQVNRPGAAFERDATGKPSDESMKQMQASADREEGPWFAVHRGYEVQIAGAGDTTHGTGSIYSLAPTTAVSRKSPGEWRTMVITLAGEKIFVDLDGQRTTNFDPTSPDLPPRKQWHEPKREPKRPVSGYLGLQTHDPGDVVWYKEVTVRPLPKAAK